MAHGPQNTLVGLILIGSLLFTAEASAQEESDPITDAVDAALASQEPAPAAEATPGQEGAAGEEGADQGEEPQEQFAPRTETAEPDPRALELYLQAEDAYSHGRYQEAVTLLEEALTYDPNAPDLLYNLALVHERLGHLDEALTYLERYRQFELGEEEQGRVDRMMVRIRGAREHTPEPPPPEVRTRVVTRRFGRADAWFWSMLGVTILFTGGAVVTGVLALDWEAAAAEFRLGANGDHDDYRYLADTAETLALLTDIGIGLASAAALTTLLLYVLRTHEVEEAVEGEGQPATEPAAAALIPRVSAGPGGFVLAWDL